MPQVIVCVSRDRDALSSWARVLSDKDFRVEPFVDGARCEAFLAENDAAVVVAEFVPPGDDVIVLFARVRGLRPAAQRILVASKFDLDAASRAFNRGEMDYLLLKPYEEGELAALVGEACRRRGMVVERESLGRLLAERNAALEGMTRQLESNVQQRTRQIETAKKEWERTFDAISAPLTLVTPDFVLRRVNLAAAGQARTDVRQVPGRRCFEALFGRAEPCPECPVADRTREWTAMDHAEARIRDERQERAFRLSVYVSDAGPLERRFICYYQDVTEEVRLQRQVVQSEKLSAIGQLAGGVAHEINNPIGVILSFAQLSRTAVAVKDMAELADNLEEIEKAARRCEKIVRSLLDFARPSVDEEFVPVDLNEVVSNAVFLVGTQRAMKNIAVERRLDPDLPRILGNGNQLLQVFVNLVQNAAQAMKGGGELGLTTENFGTGWVRAGVRDSGVGIAAEHMNRIFEPFFTTKPPGTGTGLGLSVSYSIVERHGGRIEVTSKVGQGSEFSVLLPIQGKE